MANQSVLVYAPMQSGIEGCHLPKLSHMDTIEAGERLSDIVCFTSQVTFTTVPMEVSVVLIS
jgi:hypothetical protein